MIALSAGTLCAQVPTITSFTPTSGPVGTTVTITGTNFDATPENNIVWFGAVRATVVTASVTELDVSVPAGVTYQPITVTVKGLTAYSGTPFIITFTGSGVIDATSFAAKVDFPSGMAPLSAGIGDIDGDGKPDLVITNDIDTAISVYRNISSSGSVSAGSFAPGVHFTTGSIPNNLAMGDIDGDGKLDLAVANSGSNSVSVFRNTSTPGSLTSGSFAARIDFTTGVGPEGIVIGDIDGDGKPDLAVANFHSTSVSVFRNTCITGSISETSFAPSVNFHTGMGSNPCSVAIGDIDGDAKPDLAVTNGSGNTVTIFRNTSSSGSITTASLAPGVDFITGNGPRKIASGDLDGDGKPDLVIANNISNSISVLRNTGLFGSITAGSFAEKVDFTNNDAPICTAIGDIDGDGKPDLVVSTTGFKISVFRNTSTSGIIETGSFGTNVDFNTGMSPLNFGIGDIDCDGKPDLVVANYGSNTVSVLRNTISEQVTMPPIITSFTPTSGPAGTSVTINGSYFSTTGTSNIVWFGAVQATVTSATANQLTVLVPIGTTHQPISVTVNGLTAWSDKSFNVTFPGSQIIDSSSFAQKVDFTTGMYPSAAVGDIDCDGKPDIIVSNAQDNQISVLKNISFSGFISPASFTEKVDFTTGTNPFFTDLGDLDGDGKQDLAVFNLNGISVFRNTSTTGSINAGSFADKIDFAAGGGSRCVAIRDIDGDGKPDMAITNYESNTVSIFRNTSSPGSLTTASFAAKVDITTGINPNYVVIAEIDGDGKPDLLVSNTNSYSISVFRNISTQGIIETGSFSEKVDFPTGGDPVCIAVGDLDGDDKADMTALNNYNGTVSIFRNTSTSGSISESSFAAKVDFTSESMPEYVSIGDINGDGKPDLAISNAPKNIDFTWVGGNTISIFRNTSTPGSITSGSFAPRVDFATGYFPFRVSIGDIDGDYKPDLVVANGYTNSFSILRNTITESVPPVINSLTPTYGPVGAPVSITGSNFSTIPEDNIVMFGNVQATVTGASRNQLTVLVPAGSDGQSISVTVYGQTAYFDVSFTLTDPMDIELESAILTLNGDGINEHFVVKNFQAYGASKFYVYNGRGTLVYWNTDFQGEWDVTLHNRRFDTGGYFYVIETSIGTFRGSFSILK
ncbi:MAG: FG-GAP-like repeat-containing protein [Bacteroidota bacterium]